MRPSSPKSTRKATDLDGQRLKSFVSAQWDDAVVPSLTDYIRIPNKSPAFDKDWVEAHGSHLIDRLIGLALERARREKRLRTSK